MRKRERTMAKQSESVYKLQGLSCANCATKFEKNIQDIDTVDSAKVNFAAQKVTVAGEVTIDQLEKAGAFDHIKVRSQNDDAFQHVPFWKKRENILAGISLVILLMGLGLQFTFGKEHPLVITTFIIAILVGGYDLFITGIKNLFRFYFDLHTLMSIAIIFYVFFCDLIVCIIVYSIYHILLIYIFIIILLVVMYYLFITVYKYLFRFYFDLHTLMTIAIIGAAFIGEWVEGAAVVILFAISEALESYSVDKARQSI